MKIITLSGLDGSGKSTQIEMLKNYLEAQGKRVFYFHAVNFSLANKIKKRGQKAPSKSVTEASWLAVQLRKIFLKIDIFRLGKFYKKLEKQGYDYILSDRYFYDSIVNIYYLTGGDFSNWKPRFQKSLIRSNLAIYLEVNPEIIMQRERKPDQGLEYLKKKSELYSKISTSLNLTTIDGTRDKNIIFEEIKSLSR